jgi:hypothetical protein
VVLIQLRKTFLSLAVHVQLIQGQQPGGHLQDSLEVAEGPPPAEPWFSLNQNLKTIELWFKLLKHSLY